MKSFENHIHPEKEEQLRQTKIEVENKVKKILKATKGMHGSKEGNSKKEIIHLVEDFLQHYESLYSMYEDLREEAKNNINVRDDGSSTPSDSEVYYSPVDFTHKNSRESGSETEDVEDTILKDKVTSSSEMKDAPFGSHSFFEDLREAKDSEGEVARLKFEIRTLLSHKKHWEKQVECKANEALQMKERISKLKDRIVELESKCKDKERLQQEVRALSLEKGQLEEKLSRETKERSIEVRDLVEQVDCLNQEVVFVTSQKAELELELNRKSEEMVEHLVRMENKYRNLPSTEQGRGRGENSSRDQAKDFKHDGHGNKSYLEELFAKLSQESRQLVVEKQELQRKMSQMQTSLLISERKLAAQENKIKLSEKGLSAQIKALNQKAKNQDSKMEALHKEKCSLQAEVTALRNDKKRNLMELEKEKQESLLTKSKMERKNNELATKIADQQKTLLELGDIINTLRMDNIKAYPNFQVMEAKIEEMAEEYRNQFEDKYRAMSRRIRAAEKLHGDYREWYVKTKEAYKQENKTEQGKIETVLSNIRDMSLTANDVLVSLDSVGLKFEECNASFLNRISKTSCEVNYAKDWVRRKNTAILQVKHDLDDLLCQLDEKEGEILELRERVWNLENKLKDADKKIKEREDGVYEVREEKREAIRQLCVWIDYHRCRTDYYKKMMKRMPKMTSARCRSVS